MIYLIHAFPLSPSMYQPLMANLERPSKALTLPGFAGRALPDGAPNLGAFAQDVVSQIDQESVVLAGCSLGGYVIMEILRQRLIDPDAIILMDTKHTADAPEAVANRVRIAERAEAGDVDVTALSAPLLGSKSADLLTSVQALVRATPGSTIGWTQRAMALRPDSSDVLRSFANPALVIVGEEDALAPVPVAQEMASLLPRGALEVIDGAGHLAPWEKPLDVAGAINSFLRAG